MFSTVLSIQGRLFIVIIIIIIIILNRRKKKNVYCTLFIVIKKH